MIKKLIIFKKDSYFFNSIYFWIILYLCCRCYHNKLFYCCQFKINERKNINSWNNYVFVSSKMQQMRETHCYYRSKWIQTSFFIIWANQRICFKTDNFFTKISQFQWARWHHCTCLWQAKLHCIQVFSCWRHRKCLLRNNIKSVNLHLKKSCYFQSLPPFDSECSPSIPLISS